MYSARVVSVQDRPTVDFLPGSTYFKGYASSYHLLSELALCFDLRPRLICPLRNMLWRSKRHQWTGNIVPEESLRPTVCLILMSGSHSHCLAFSVTTADGHDVELSVPGVSRAFGWPRYRFRIIEYGSCPGCAKGYRTESIMSPPGTRAAEG